jgi:hypothetical protein
VSSVPTEKRQPSRLRPWTAMPQGFLRRPEVMRLSKEAKLLFWAMTDHACEQMTDGAIQDVELQFLFAVAGADSSALGELTMAGVIEHMETGYQLRDFLEYSRSREDREAARANSRERVARHRRGAASVEPPPPPPALPFVMRYETHDVTRPVMGSVLSTEGKKESESESESEDPQLSKGQRVRHAGYGPGEVLHVNGNEVNVRFQAGIKRMYAHALTVSHEDATL